MIKCTRGENCEDRALFDLSVRECNLKFKTFETFHSDVSADRNQFQITQYLTFEGLDSYIWKFCHYVDPLKKKERDMARIKDPQNYLHCGCKTAEVQTLKKKSIKESLWAKLQRKVQTVIFLKTSFQTFDWKSIKVWQTQNWNNTLNTLYISAIKWIVPGDKIQDQNFQL